VRTTVSYPYENDGERIAAMSRRIRLERLEDVALSSGYVLHDSRWWRVTGGAPSEGGADVEGIYLEIAGSSDPLRPESGRLDGLGGDLVVYADPWAGLQFRDGALLDTTWPGWDLIYIRDARRRGIGDDPEEKVHGIFSLRLDSDGGDYYAPVDQEHQPGVASTWYLFPDCDLILDWEPVDVADLLFQIEARDGQV